MYQSKDVLENVDRVLLSVRNKNKGKYGPPIETVTIDLHCLQSYKELKFSKQHILQNTTSLRSENDWSLITLKSFEVKNPTNLAFEWKNLSILDERIIYLDYIQIKKL